MGFDGNSYRRETSIQKVLQLVAPREQKNLSAFWRGGFFIIRVNKESLPAVSAIRRSRRASSGARGCKTHTVFCIVLKGLVRLVPDLYFFNSLIFVFWIAEYYLFYYNVDNAAFISFCNSIKQAI